MNNYPNKYELMEKGIDLIIKDLNNRKGFDLDSLDHEIRKEIRDKWIKIMHDTVRQSDYYGK